MHVEGQSHGQTERSITAFPGRMQKNLQGVQSPVPDPNTGLTKHDGILPHSPPQPKCLVPK